MSARAGRLAVWPPLPTEEELTTAGLSRDGQHVMGWVKPPADKVWTPNDGTLLWRPPSATKSTDLDAAGRIVDVILTPGGTAAWVVAQLDRHEKYLDMLRDRVRSGVMRLTAALAKKLGLYYDGALLEARGPTTPPDALASVVRAEYERFVQNAGRRH